MDSGDEAQDAGTASGLGRTERDILGLTIVFSAILMFVGTGGDALPQLVNALAGVGIGPDRLLANALLLNIALVIFGWRRYAELREEVRERRRAEAQARMLADVDPLTGCLNRRALPAATAELIAAARARGEVAGFIVIDLDNFKPINDCHGHAGGDLILAETAARIRATIPPDGLLARLGGDEFACVVPFVPHWPDRIDKLATALIAAIGAPVTGIDFTAGVAASLGLSRSDMAGGHATPDTPVDPAVLLHMADIAMYQAKKAGRNRYMWFEPSMEQELRYRSEMEAAIRDGIARGEFVPHYEQQIDLATGRITGFEMLARWTSAKFGAVPPDVFIPIAEEIGVIGTLSEMLIAQALHDAKCWDASLNLAVNISPIQLRDPWFAQRLLRLLTAANFPPARLDIEITETSLNDDHAGVEALVTSLANQGIGITLDDFGTGYSSLARLNALPFDRVKIDRSFVMALASEDASGSSEAAAIIRSIAALGDGLGLPIIAEGIENEVVLSRLRAVEGMTAASHAGRALRGQGYLYGRPQPADQVRELLAREGLLMGGANASAAPPPSPPRKTKGADATRSELARNTGR